MTRKKSSEERIRYRIKDAVGNLDKKAVEFILFAHAFTGCDTTSAIHMLGKKSIFLKMESSETLRNIATSLRNFIPLLVVCNKFENKNMMIMVASNRLVLTLLFYHHLQ